MDGESTTMREQRPAAAKPPIKLALSSSKEPHFVEGRRPLWKYRDLGVTDASGGRMRAQVTSGKDGMTQPTGWHDHLCETQFVYILSGWVELEFEKTGLVRLEAGDSVMIPGSLPHQETRTSDDFELLEVSLPAEMGTKSCDPPAP